MLWNFSCAVSSLRTSVRECPCCCTRQLHANPTRRQGNDRSGWTDGTFWTTSLRQNPQHSLPPRIRHYPCPWCWTSCCCESITSLPPSLNTSPHSAGTATAHHQPRNRHIWHRSCSHSSPLYPLVARSVCWPSSDGSCRGPARTRRSGFQSPLCTHPTPGGSLGSRLVFSGTQSTLLRLWSDRSKPRKLLCRPDRQSTRHLWFCRTGNGRSSHAVRLWRRRYSTLKMRTGRVANSGGARIWGGRGVAGWIRVRMRRVWRLDRSILFRLFHTKLPKYLRAYLDNMYSSRRPPDILRCTCSWMSRVCFHRWHPLSSCVCFHYTRQHL